MQGFLTRKILSPIVIQHDIGHDQNHDRGENDGEDGEFMHEFILNLLGLKTNPTFPSGGVFGSE
jgi:hypothetical protein